MTPNEAIRRITQRAMERHRSHKGALPMRSAVAMALSQSSWTSRRCASLQEQWFYLMTLGGKQLA